jgi:hypothetical protein
MVEKALEKSRKIAEGFVGNVQEGQSEDAPVDLPGTQKERAAEHPEHVVDKRTGLPDEKTVKRERGHEPDR